MSRQTHHFINGRVVEGRSGRFGDVNQHRPEGVRFFTKIKTVASRWPLGGVGDGADIVIPTMK